ncbi:MAG: tetratricopeptide repeat protein [Cyanobacteria bacterium J06643_5]
MTSESIDWDEDLPAEPEEEYQAFLRTLERTEGFRLLFVQCTPVEGDELITRVKEELPKKTIEVLQFEKPIDNLYQIVKDLPNREEINILFIQGLEHSLYEYEQTKFGEKSERFAYSWKGVPKILNHLNLHRERFRDTFDICFVFLLRSFSLKYFIRRAPDFFDWRSSIFEFPTKPELLEQESSRLIEEGDYKKYRNLTLEEKIKKSLDIEELIQEKHQTADNKAELLREKGRIFDAAEEYEAALVAIDKAIEIKPEYHSAWNNRGQILRELRRLEEAVTSYDKAIEIKPEYYQAWVNRGNILLQLRRLEEAVTSYDKAIEIKPDYHQAWVFISIALRELGSLEKAVTSCDKAIEIKPDSYVAWRTRGIALKDLGRLEEALTAYDKAVEIKPDYHLAWNNRGIALKNLGRLEEAVLSYDKAIKIKPNYHIVWSNRGIALKDLGRLKEALVAYDKAIEIKPNYHVAWRNRGIALKDLGRLEEAITAYDKAIEFKPDYHVAWRNRGSALIKLGRWKNGNASIKKALELNPNYQKEILKQRINSLLKVTGLNKVYKIYTSFLKLIGFKR